jgi:hypothetical protein
VRRQCNKEKRAAAHEIENVKEQAHLIEAKLHHWNKLVVPLPFGCWGQRSISCVDLCIPCFLQVSFLEMEKSWLQDQLVDAQQQLQELHSLIKDIAPLLQNTKFINISEHNIDTNIPMDKFASVANGNFHNYMALHDDHVVLLQDKIGFVVVWKDSLPSIPDAKLIRFSLSLLAFAPPPDHLTSNTFKLCTGG